ncbi:LOW QUALITY PROTEIN: armadillo repeat-containing protein 7 [Malaya genurostris]|uniref:LOW QUALITY PROTEIN: armadillo repeat-containing protein 7 n=1 Tax=Malaya genurostris TaxID=325434 RepID=UPI0026F3FBCC|nr:LOW QUALITY PROTEIN: armadillo repeat-containing protein 7 [Malaya genurostris]
MFSSFDRLKKRTPNEGINRREYISLLVDEYYETNNLEAQQQVTANLANFAYDPINWNFLKSSKAHELFVEILNCSIDLSLLIHAAAGICNLCLDTEFSEYVRRGGVLKQIKFLIGKYSKNTELIAHLLTILIYLNNEPIEDDFRQLCETLRTGSNRLITNLVNVFMEDYVTQSRRLFSNQKVLTLCRTFREEDLLRFAEFTGDSNPIHQHKTAQHRFVNGALLNAVTAGIIGSNFPGHVVTSQEFRFPKRCRLDEEAVFTVKVENLRKIVSVSYYCKQGGQTVFVGSAKLFAMKL